VFFDFNFSCLVINHFPKLPWGSVSRIVVERLFLIAKTAARFAAIVVLPDPPFCCAMVITFDTYLSIKINVS
jgi:hypothetical protein